MSCRSGLVFSYKLRYIVGVGLVAMAISTNPTPTIYRNLYGNTTPGLYGQMLHSNEWIVHQWTQQTV